MIDRETAQQWATWSLSPSIPAIIFTLLLSLTLPILVHSYLYRSRASSSAPSFLIIGPSGSGKTSFLTLVRDLLAREEPRTDRHSSNADSQYRPILPKNHKPRHAHSDRAPLRYPHSTGRTTIPLPKRSASSRSLTHPVMASCDITRWKH